MRIFQSWISTMTYNIPKKNILQTSIQMIVQTVLLMFNIFFADAQSFTIFSLQIQTIFYTISVITIFAFILNFSEYIFLQRNYSGIFVKHIKLIAPSCIIGLGQIAQYQNLSNQIFSIVMCLTLWILWMLRILIVRQNYLNINGKLTINYDVIYSLLFISTFLTRFFALLVVDSQTFSIILIILVAASKIWHFQYISEELEYMDLLCQAGLLQTCLVYLLQNYLKLNYDPFLFITLNLALYVILVISNFLKVCAELKYFSMISNFKVNPNDDQYILIFHLLNTLKQQKYFKFRFYKELNYLYYKLDKQRTMDAKSKTKLLNYLAATCLSKNRWDYKLNLYFGHWYLQQENYVYSIECSQRARMNQKSNWIYQISLEVFRMRIKQSCSIRAYLNNIDANANLCTIQRFQVKEGSEYIVKYQEILLELISKIQKITQYTKEYLKLISKEKINQSLILQSIQNTASEKQQVRCLIQNNPGYLQNKQFLFTTYIYMYFVCSQKYYAHECLSTYFDHIQNKSRNTNLKPLKPMVVLVSAKPQSIGTITHASIETLRFFNLKQERIDNRSLNISLMMQSSIANSHDQLMLSFLERGTSQFIGKQKQLIVVKKKDAYIVSTLVKLHVSSDELVFIGHMTVKTDIVVAYNKQGHIEGRSKELLDYIDISNNMNNLIVQRNSVFNRFSTVFLTKDKPFRTTKALFYQQQSVNAFLGYCTLPLFKGSDLDKRRTKDQSNSRITSGNRIYASKQINSFPQLEDSISRISGIDTNLQKFILVTIIYIIFYGLVASNSYNIASNLTQVVQNNVNLYNEILVGFTSRLFDASNAYLIAAADLDGWGDDTTMANLGVQSVATQFYGRMSEIFNDTLNIQQYMIQNINEVTSGYLNLFNTVAIPISSNISRVSVNYLQAISLQKSYLIEVFNLNYLVISQPQLYQLNYVFQFYKNDFIVKLNSTVFGPLQDMQTQQIANLGQSYLIFVCVCFSLLIFIKVYIIKTRSVYQQQISRHISILYKLDRKDIQRKVMRNDQIQNIMSKLNIYRQISWKDLQTQQQVTSDLASLKSKSIIKHNDTLSSKLTSSIICILVIGGLLYLLIASVSFEQSSIKGLDLYYSDLEDIESERTALSMLLNICQDYYYYFNMSNRMFDKPMNYLYPIVVNSIIQRDIDQKIASYFDWNLARPLLYDSLCDSNDTVCLRVMEGSANRGLISAISTYTQNTLTLQSWLAILVPQYDANLVLNPLFNGLLESFYILQNEVMYAYINYIYPRMDLLGDLSMQYCVMTMNAGLQNLYESLISVVCTICTLEILWFVYNIKYRCRQLRQVKTEILTFDTVDLMWQIMGFKNQLRML